MSNGFTLNIRTSLSTPEESSTSWHIRLWVGLMIMACAIWGKVLICVDQRQLSPVFLLALHMYGVSASEIYVVPVAKPTSGEQYKTLLH